MKHLGEKEQIDIVIPKGESTIAVEFSESYSVPPTVNIDETDGAVDVPASVTTVGCVINAINSKADINTNTDGRIIKLSIIV